MADSNKLKYRQLLYAVSTRLSQEDVRDMMYLAAIEHQQQESVQSGTDFFTILEQKGLLDERNYSYLVSLLETVGRIDLIKRIFSDFHKGIALTSPERQDSFSIPKQLAIIKRGQMLGKRELYVRSTQKLEAVFKCTIARKQRFEDYFFQILSDLQFTESDPSYTTEANFTEQRVCKLLKSMSLWWKIWPKTLALFQQTGDCRTVECLVTLCHENYHEFSTQVPKSYGPLTDILQKIQFKVDHRDHVVGKIAQNSHQVLQELLLELLGPQEALTVADASFSEAVFTLESMSYCAQYLFPFTKWVLMLTHAVQEGHVNLKHIQDIVLLIASNHKVEIVRNCDKIAKILGQDSLDEILTHIPTADQTSVAINPGGTEPAIHSTIISTTHVIWYTCLAILVQATLPNNPQIKPCCFKSVRSELRKFMMANKEKLMCAYISNSTQIGVSMQNELRKYKSKSEHVILELTDGSQQSAEIVRSVFSKTV